MSLRNLKTKLNMKHELDRMMSIIKDYETGYGGVTDSFLRKELEMFAKDYHKEQCNIANVVDRFEPDWNEIIKEFHEIYTKIWEDDLQTKETEKIKSLFLNRVLRNAPNEAQDLLFKLQKLI